MGADLSSCCSVEPAGDKSVVSAKKAAEGGEGTEAPQMQAKASSPASSSPALPQFDVEKFSKKVEEGMDVIVLLADGTKLACQLKLNKDERSVSISCEKNLRIIPLSELKTVLHGKDQLKRVETKANLVDDPNCVALHMATGNCIPMRFDELDDKECFVLLIKTLR